MQERFRFRVWNIKEKEMIYNAEIAYDGMNYNTDWQLGNNQNDGWVDCFGYYLDYEHQDYEIMQCTGLKDNNGKLIYEGDIVRFYSPYGHATFEIKWSEEFATFGYEDNETDFSEFGRLYDDARYVEVIGNIYENKELLESEG